MNSETARLPNPRDAVCAHCFANYLKNGLKIELIMCLGLAMLRRDDHAPMPYFANSNEIELLKIAAFEDDRLWMLRPCPDDVSSW